MRSNRDGAGHDAFGNDHTGCNVEIREAGIEQTRKHHFRDSDPGGKIMGLG